MIDFFTPDVFMGDLATGEPFTPLMWYFIPMYLLIAVLAFIITALADHKQFAEDWRTFTAWLRRVKEKLKKDRADDTQE